MSMKLKLIVNSNTRTSHVLTQFLLSLLSINFSDFHNVVAIVGGSQHNSPPYIEKANGHMPSYIKIDTQYSYLDYTGFIALRKHLNHTLLESDAYLYLLDSVVFSPTFLQFYSRFERGKLVRTSASPWVVSGKLPSSNVCVFSRACALKYDINITAVAHMTKKIAIGIEKGTGHVPHVTQTCKHLDINVRRYKMGDARVYDRRFRSIYYYPFFGIFKSIGH